MSNTIPFIRIGKVILSITAIGIFAATLTFYLVSLQPEERTFDTSGAESYTAPEFPQRFMHWVKTVVGSGFANWGGSRTAPNITEMVKERLPVSAGIGISSWLLGWLGGLALAIWLVKRRELARIHLRMIYPVAQAIPSLTVVFLVYSLLILSPGLLDRFGLVAGIATLAVLIVPAASALWLAALQRILKMEFIRVARATGIKPKHLWTRHIIPNAIASSGVLTQAAFSLAGLVVGSIFVERVFSLGGISDLFIDAIKGGQAELAATAVIVYFIPIAIGVCLAEGIVLLIAPQQSSIL